MILGLEVCITQPKYFFSFKCYFAVGCRVCNTFFRTRQRLLLIINTVYQKMRTHDRSVAKLPNHNAV